MAKTNESPDFPRPHPIKITVSSAVRTIAISSESGRKTLEFLMRQNGVTCDEMALYFVGKPKISRLHQAFFSDKTPTDCITLPYNEPATPPPAFFGELFVCPPMAAEYVKKSGGDLYREITLYVVHGFLHLMGFDDQTAEEREKMRKAEVKWMGTLEKNGLGITP